MSKAKKKIVVNKLAAREKRAMLGGQIGKSKRKQLTSDVKAFFDAAGVRAYVTVLNAQGKHAEAYGRLKRANGLTHAISVAGGRPAKIPDSVLIGGQARLDFIDKLVIRQCPSRLVERLRVNAPLFGDDLQAFLARDSNAFLIEVQGVSRMRLSATRARVFGAGGEIAANFLTDGDHWIKLRDELARAIDQDGAAARSGELFLGSYPVVVKSVPECIPLTLADACVEASRRIRLDRQVAYARPVVMEMPTGALRLFPVAGSEAGPIAPFELELDGAAWLGVILLTSDLDPLEMRFQSGEPSDPTIGYVWSAALLGLAAVTSYDPSEIKANREQREPAAGLDSRRQSMASTQRASGRLNNPDLVEIRSHGQHGAHFVAGHRRRLADGRTPSADARAKARRLGIELRRGETWVTAHERGVAEGQELRYRWRVPRELLEFRSG